MADPNAPNPFERLLDRQLSDAERARLLQLQKALKLADDDPLWVVFYALGHYQTLYEAMPARVEAAGNNAAAKITAQIEHGTAAVERRAEAAIRADLATALERIAGPLTRRRTARALALTALAIALIMVGVAGATAYGVREHYRERLAFLQTTLEDRVARQVAERTPPDVAPAQLRFTDAYRGLWRDPAFTAAVDRLAELRRDDLGNMTAVEDMLGVLFEDGDAAFRTVTFAFNNQRHMAFWQGLSADQRQRLVAIGTEAPLWQPERQRTGAPWPCVATLRDTHIFDGDPATMCLVGLGNR